MVPPGWSFAIFGSQNGVFLKIAEGRALTLAPGTDRQSRPSVAARANRPAPATLSSTTIAPGNEVAGTRSRKAPRRFSGEPHRQPYSTAPTPRCHAAICRSRTERGRLLLRDLGSRNGTFVKIEGAWPLQDGDLLWLGNQVLRLSTLPIRAPPRHHSSRARQRNPVPPPPNHRRRRRPPQHPRPVSRR